MILYSYISKGLEDMYFISQFELFSSSWLFPTVVWPQQTLSLFLAAKTQLNKS